MRRFSGSVVVSITVSLIAHVALTPATLARQYSVTPIPAGGFDSVHPNDLNNAGQVVGRRAYVDQFRPQAGFMWSREAGIVDLGEGRFPYAINDQGVVVGRSAQPIADAGSFI
jgi:hypothetical protein